MWATGGLLWLVLAARPTLSGPEMIHDSDDGHFKVHFTDTGVDAIANPMDVQPANGIPDLVDDIELGMHRVWEAFVEQDGWPAPPTDNGRGGDDRLDVYITQLSNNGLAWSERTANGNTAYFQINNTSESLSAASAQSVAGHELHHGLQYAVSTAQQAPWIAEATSTWVQYRLFTGGPLDIAREVLWSVRLSNAARDLDATGDRFEYAGMTWLQFLLDKGHQPRTALLDLWRDLDTAGEWEAGHRRAMPRLGFASLEDAVAQFAEWNLFACYRDDGHHFDNAGLPCGFEAEVPVRSVSVFPEAYDTPTVGRFGAVYVEPVRDCMTSTAVLSVRSTQPFAVRTVRARATGGAVGVGEMFETGSATVTAENWNDEARLVFALVNLGAPQTFHVGVGVRGMYQPHATADAAASLRVGGTGVTVLEPAESTRLAALGRFGSCADDSDVTASAQWHSSDPLVATVTNGNVVALRVGHAEITAANAEVQSNAVGIDVTKTRHGLLGGCSQVQGSAWVLVTLMLWWRRRTWV